jgi:hypothetical protein
MIVTKLRAPFFINCFSAAIFRPISTGRAMRVAQKTAPS